VDQRSSDQRLDEGIVSALVAAQFPDRAGQPISRLGAGWDHELFCAGRQWIFRFPRRAERVPWLLREIEITAISAETMPATIPVFEKIGEPSRAFPYPFVGYRKVPGAGADHSRGRDLAGLAADIGRLFSALHSIDLPASRPPRTAGNTNRGVSCGPGSPLSLTWPAPSCGRICWPKLSPISPARSASRPRTARGASSTTTSAPIT
jgi:aminoglycoside phosphotransferase (APT) family kinase protein